MHSTKVIHTVSCHAEGEVGDVIVGGVSPPPGETIWEQRKWIAQDNILRNFMLNEPRGGVFRHVNLLVPPKNPDAQAAWIIMEPEDTPPMSGSNSICVATVLLDTGIIPMQEPITDFILEAPRRFVRVRAYCVNGNEAENLAELGVRITNAANEQLTFRHPIQPEWRHHSFCLFAGALERRSDGLRSKSIVSIQPGKLDRSPTGTAVSARMALLHATGEMKVGESLTGVSIIGSEFHGKILGETKVGAIEAIRPQISGRGWVTGTHQHMLDPSDPWPEGYRIGDTWPRYKKSIV